MRVLLALYLVMCSASRRMIPVDRPDVHCGLLSDAYPRRFHRRPFPWALSHHRLVLHPLYSRPSGARILSHRFLLFLALALLALGSGTIKPNTSVLMGLMYERLGKGHLLDVAFAYYYAAINLGSTIASFSLPIVQLHYGYGIALLIPAILIALSMIIFVLGRSHFPPETVRWHFEPKSAEQKKLERALIARLAGVLALVRCTGSLPISRPRPGCSWPTPI